MNFIDFGPTSRKIDKNRKKKCSKSAKNPLAALLVHIAGLVTGAGGKFLEAPVAGHSGMAKAKTIQFLVSGDKDQEYI